MDLWPWYTGAVLVGVVLGVLTLPMGGPGAVRNPLLTVLAWTCFWPYLLVVLVPRGLRRYAVAWRRYQDRRLAWRSRARVEE